MKLESDESLEVFSFDIVKDVSGDTTDEQIRRLVSDYKKQAEEAGFWVDTYALYMYISRYRCGLKLSEIWPFVGD